MTKKRITIERSYDATLATIWDLWTTKEGIELWWGPEGFSVEVRQLDLRPGGELLYAMTATAAEQVSFMTKAGMPLTTEVRLRYTEVKSQRHLAYETRADFIPGVEPYDIATTLDLRLDRGAAKMTLTFDAMHDDQWTKRAVDGRTGEIVKLSRALKERL